MVFAGKVSKATFIQLPKMREVKPVVYAQSAMIYQMKYIDRNARVEDGSRAGRWNLACERDSAKLPC